MVHYAYWGHQLKKKRHTVKPPGRVGIDHHLPIKTEPLSVCHHWKFSQKLDANCHGTRIRLW
jgi:hypothetical protein